MNKYDSLLAEGRFLAEGYRLTDEMEDADVVLFNTCSVRDHAEERVFSWLGELRGLRARRPDLVVGVMGCMAQRKEDGVFARTDHVDLVCGTRRFQHLPALVEEVRARRSNGGDGRPARVLDVDMAGDVRVDRSDEPYTGGLLGYLAVMRGCDLNCTFCIVPTVRGRVKSRPIEELVREARWMVAGGARVITLLGQTVDAYGEDLEAPPNGTGSGRQGRPALADLLRALQEVRGLERIRLVTLHPAYVTPALARAIAECPKVDRFLPLPAQSGSDAVLRRMRRGYTTDLYRSRIETLRAEVPDIELGSDWIVGFPGETEEDFERTLAFLEGGRVQPELRLQVRPAAGNAGPRAPRRRPRDGEEGPQRAPPARRRIGRPRTPPPLARPGGGGLRGGPSGGRGRPAPRAVLPQRPRPFRRSSRARRTVGHRPYRRSERLRRRRDAPPAGLREEAPEEAFAGPVAAVARMRRGHEKTRGLRGSQPAGDTPTEVGEKPTLRY